MKEAREDARNNVLAVLGSSDDKKSIRQEKLSQQARDFLAFIFQEKVQIETLLTVAISAVEVLIKDDLDAICYGQGTVVFHGGSDSDKYFKHCDDPGWAIVYRSDCDGDADRGGQIMDRIVKINGDPAL